jgi:threonine synthase
MRFISTQARAPAAALSDAVRSGLAPDGGLYIPSGLPNLADLQPQQDLPSLAEAVLAPFAEGDALEKHLRSICKDAFDFPAPLVPLDRAAGPVSVLELFHGPTCAFKDFGARFLAASLARLWAHAPRPLTVLVATSGDTGGAVAAAFHRRPWAEVVLLYPRNLVSPRQAQQLSCWGDNVRTFAVSGTFDDCQRMVKGAFRDPELSARRAFSSANSINIGRLLPQIVYYASSSLAIWRAEGRRPNFIVPSGNLGNAAACLLARDMGLPIGDIVLATNANRTIVDYVEHGKWRPRPSVATLASAMDVGDPSNMERLRVWAGDFDGLRGVHAQMVSDDEIRRRIREDASALGRVWCPHSATAAEVYHRLAPTRGHEHWVIVATAHPAKFEEIVEPLIGRTLPIPPNLDRLLRLPRHDVDLAPTLDALRAHLSDGR